MAGVAIGMPQAEAQRLMTEHRFLKSCAAGYAHRPQEEGRRWTMHENIRDCRARVRLAVQEERRYRRAEDWRNITARARRVPPVDIEAPAGLNHRERRLLSSIVGKQRDYATARRRYLEMREARAPGDEAVRDAAARELKQQADRVVRAHREAHGIDDRAWGHPRYIEPVAGAVPEEDIAGEEPIPAAAAEVDDAADGGEEFHGPAAEVGAVGEHAAQENAEEPPLAADRHALVLAIAGLHGGVVDADWDASVWSRQDVVAAKSALDRRAAILAAGLQVLPDGTRLPTRDDKGLVSPGCRGPPRRTMASCVFPCAWKRGRNDPKVMCRSARRTRTGYYFGNRPALPALGEDVD
jgi:hypothetical protein